MTNNDPLTPEDHRQLHKMEELTKKLIKNQADVARDEIFINADTDEDGVISPEETQAYNQQVDDYYQVLVSGVKNSLGHASGGHDSSSMSDDEIDDAVTDAMRPFGMERELTQQQLQQRYDQASKEVGREMNAVEKGLDQYNELSKSPAFQEAMKHAREVKIDPNATIDGSSPSAPPHPSGQGHSWTRGD